MEKESDRKYLPAKIARAYLKAHHTTPTLLAQQWGVSRQLIYYLQSGRAIVTEQRASETRLIAARMGYFGETAKAPHEYGKVAGGQVDD